MEGLTSKLGPLAWKTFDFERYAEVLDARNANGQPNYTAAYMIASRIGNFRDPRKHRNHLRLLEWMMRERLPSRIERARSLCEVYEILRAVPSLGDFLAFQFAIDLNYSEMIDFSRWTLSLQVQERATAYVNASQTLAV